MAPLGKTALNVIADAGVQVSTRAVAKLAEIVPDVAVVAVTPASLTAFESAVETKSESEAALESLVVCNVEITRLSETALESAVEMSSDCDASFEFDVVVRDEINTLWLVSRLEASESFVDIPTLSLTAFESATLMSVD